MRILKLSFVVCTYNCRSSLLFNLYFQNPIRRMRMRRREKTYEIMYFCV